MGMNHRRARLAPRGRPRRRRRPVDADGRARRGGCPTKAWIDQPLPGAVLVFGPTPVTVHAASDSGIAKVRLPRRRQPDRRAPATGGDLVMVVWTWTPATPGQHLPDGRRRGRRRHPVRSRLGGGHVRRAGGAAALGAAVATGSPRSSPGASGGATTAPGRHADGGPHRRGVDAEADPDTSGTTPSPTRTPARRLPDGCRPRSPRPRHPRLHRWSTPTATPRPTPTPCAPPAPNLLFPSDGAALNEATPTFEWAVLRRHDLPAGQLPGRDLRVAHVRHDGDAGHRGGRPVLLDERPGLIACVTYSWRVVPLGGVAGHALGGLDVPPHRASVPLTICEGHGSQRSGADRGCRLRRPAAAAAAEHPEVELALGAVDAAGRCCRRGPAR